jgi:hypothetical protein
MYPSVTQAVTYPSVTCHVSSVTCHVCFGHESCNDSGRPSFRTLHTQVTYPSVTQAVTYPSVTYLRQAKFPDADTSFRLLDRDKGGSINKVAARTVYCTRRAINTGPVVRRA